MIKYSIFLFYIFYLSTVSLKANEIILSCVDTNSDYLEYKKKIFDKHKGSSIKFSEQEFKRNYTNTITITPDKKLLISNKNRISKPHVNLYYETEKYLIFRDLIKISSYAKPYVEQLIVIDRINLKYTLQNFYQVDPTPKSWNINDLIIYADSIILSFLKNETVSEGYGATCILDEVKKKKI
jgi:hypothetical protein